MSATSSWERPATGVAIAGGASTAEPSRDDLSARSSETEQNTPASRVCGTARRPNARRSCMISSSSGARMSDWPCGGFSDGGVVLSRSMSTTSSARTARKRARSSSAVEPLSMTWPTTRRLGPRAPAHPNFRRGAPVEPELMRRGSLSGVAWLAALALGPSPTPPRPLQVLLGSPYK